jgi:uncharacterized protein (DUF302 family)
LLPGALLLGGAFADAAGPALPQLTTPYLRAATTKPFEDVVFELNHEIANENFRITGRNEIGSGIRARGYPDFPNAEVIHFCSLENAREVMEMEPGFIAFMPCRVTVHEESGKTVITMPLLPEDHADPRVTAFARRVNEKLRRIFAFAVEDEARPVPTPAPVPAGIQRGRGERP